MKRQKSVTWYIVERYHHCGQNHAISFSVLYIFSQLHWLSEQRRVPIPVLFHFLQVALRWGFVQIGIWRAINECESVKSEKAYLYKWVKIDYSYKRTKCR